MRPSQGGQYGPQPYFVGGPLSQPVRLPSRGMNNSSFMGPMTPSNAYMRPSGETLTSMMGGMPSDSPVSQTRRFNAYKDVRSDNMQSGANSSMLSVSYQPPKPGSSPLVSSVPAVDLEEALNRERDERRQLKAMLKAERKEFDLVLERLKRYESSSERPDSDTLVSELRKSERERITLQEELKLVRAELAELRNEKVLSDQLDEEHSAKMKVFTDDLLATSSKYQAEIKGLISRNEESGQQVEVLRAKAKEQERQIEHLTTVHESLNKKLSARETELVQLKKELDRQNTSSKSTDSSHRVRDLEMIIKKQNETIAALESKIRAVDQPAPADDVFGVLRNSARNLASAGPSPKGARRVSTHLTTSKDATYAPMIITTDQNDWLEPLAIAEHVLGVNK
jgi:hypothetical protein